MLSDSVAIRPRIAAGELLAFRSDRRIVRIRVSDLERPDDPAAASRRLPHHVEEERH